MIKGMKTALVSDVKPILLKLFATIVIVFMASVSFAETFTPAERPLAGGWSSISADNERVVAAAEYAVSAQAEASGEDLELIEIRGAKRQVVAGMNYQFTLYVSRNGKKSLASAVVWAKLDKTFKLTRWAWK